MRNIDADALSAFVGDLRSTLHKEQSTFKAMTQSEFEMKDNMYLNFQYAIDNAPTVEPQMTELEEHFYHRCGFLQGIEYGKELTRQQGEWVRKEDIIHYIATQYSEHNELVPIWLSIGDLKGKEDRPQGEWIIVRDKKWGDNVKCPFCGKELAGTDLNYCCKCGAKLIGSEKMNGGKEE